MFIPVYSTYDWSILTVASMFKITWPAEY